MSQVQAQISENKEAQISENKVARSIAEHQHVFNNSYRVVRIVKYKKTMICLKPVAKLVEGQPGATEPDFSDKVSVESIVEQNKDYCGLAYALRQINAGRLLPSSLNDDGRGSVDLSNVADNVNDAYRQAEADVKNAKKVQNDLGLGLIDPKHIEEYVTKAVNDRIAAIQAAQSKKEGDSK